MEFRFVGFLLLFVVFLLVRRAFLSGRRDVGRCFRWDRELEGKGLIWESCLRFRFVYLGLLDKFEFWDLVWKELEGFGGFYLCLVIDLKRWRVGFEF